MGKVRIGIIGAGNMGSGHAAHIAAGRVPHAELTAICDSDRRRTEGASERFGEGIRTFSDAAALLSSGTADGVIICTPHYDHSSLAIEAFGNGLHVMVEKPAGVYTKQVRKMNEAAAKSDRVFSIMFQRRAVSQSRKPERDCLLGGTGGNPPNQLCRHALVPGAKLL